MKFKKIILYSMSVIIICLIGILLFVYYLYRQGQVENRRPPQREFSQTSIEAETYLRELANAVESHFVMKMEYPEKLELLSPDFIEKLPLDPATQQSFHYRTDGIHEYRIEVPSPAHYQLKEFAIENGTLIQKK